MSDDLAYSLCLVYILQIVFDFDTHRAYDFSFIFLCFFLGNLSSQTVIL